MTSGGEMGPRGRDVPNPGNMSREGAKLPYGDSLGKSPDDTGIGKGQGRYGNETSEGWRVTFTGTVFIDKPDTEATTSSTSVVHGPRKEAPEASGGRRVSSTVFVNEPHVTKTTDRNTTPGSALVAEPNGHSVDTPSRVDSENWDCITSFSKAFNTTSFSYPPIVVTHDHIAYDPSRVNPEAAQLDEAGTRRAIDSFSQRITSDEIDGLISDRRRPNKLPPISFSTLPILEPGRHRHRDFDEPNNRQGKFWIGGEGGLLLLGNLPDEAPVALGELGMSLQPLQEYPGINDTDPRQYPRIVQMQGCTFDGDKKARRERAVAMLNTFDLGHALTALATRFAKDNNMPAIAILPAASNRNRGKEKFNENKNAMIKRYNFTAGENGFIRQDSGLFVKELPFRQK